jgi:hypothetical protein
MHIPGLSNFFHSISYKIADKLNIVPAIPFMGIALIMATVMVIEGPFRDNLGILIAYGSCIGIASLVIIFTPNLRKTKEQREYDIKYKFFDEMRQSDHKSNENKPVSIKKPVTKSFCTNCGGKAEPNTNFCGICGKPLNT